MDIAVFVAFAQLDADHHPLAVNVGGLGWVVYLEWILRYYFRRPKQSELE